MSGAPAFGALRGAGKSSLRARDAHEGGGRGRGKKLLNRGMNLKNGNYIAKREESGPSSDPKVQEDDHVLEAHLGWPLFTDGPDKLGWLINMNSVSFSCVAISLYSQLLFFLICWISSLLFFVAVSAS